MFKIRFVAVVHVFLEQIRSDGQLSGQYDVFLNEKETILNQEETPVLSKCWSNGKTRMPLWM